MADRVSAIIAIGGVIAAETYQALIDVVAHYRLSREWGGDVSDVYLGSPDHPLELYAREVVKRHVRRPRSHLPRA